MLLSTQEKSFGLNKLGKGPLSSDKVCRENTDPLKKKNGSTTFYWSPSVRCLVDNKSKVKLIHISKQIQRQDRRELARPSQDMTALQPSRFLSKILCNGSR